MRHTYICPTEMDVAATTRCAKEPLDSLTVAHFHFYSSRIAMSWRAVRYLSMRLKLVLALVSVDSPH